MIQVVQFNLQSLSTDKCVQILKTSGNDSSMFMIQVVQFNLPSPSLC